MATRCKSTRKSVARPGQHKCPCTVLGLVAHNVRRLTGVKAPYFIGMFLFVLSVPTIVSSQVYTFDFLTYSNESHKSDFTYEKWKISWFVFDGTNEFDERGMLNSDPGEISYGELYLNVSYRFYSTKKVSLNFAHRTGMLMGKHAGYGTLLIPWLWATIRPLNSFPFFIRFAYKYGRIGGIWTRDNEFGLGVSLMHQLGLLTLESSASYRIRSIDKWRHLDFVGFFDQAGNEMHYKIEPSMKLTPNTQLSFFVMGYNSGNKKYRGRSIPDSHSHKAAFGTSFAFRSMSGKIFTFSFLWDFYGRYDKKGSAIVFNLAK